MTRLALTAALAAACATPRGASPVATTPPPRWERTVSLSPDGLSLDARTCFSGAAPARFEARASDRAVEVAGGCVAQRFSLTSTSFRGVRRYGDAVVVSNTTWLWRPDRWAPGTTVRTRFEVPDGFEVSVPWPRDAAGYAMDATAWLWEGYTAIGPFARDEIAIDGTVFDVARFGRAREARWPLAAWLGRALRAVRTLNPTLPIPRVQVLLVPSRGGGGDAVGFGVVSRGGGPSVLFLVDPDASAEALLRDWQSTHEFVHLTYPVFFDDDAWLREGIATYYQEVLRARVGAHTAAEAWANLRRGIATGARQSTGRALADESASMARSHAYQRVYWWGTSLVLLADVALRRRTGGRASMDTVLRALADAAAATPERAWSARDAVALFDRASGTDVWGSLAREALAATEYPDADATFRALGVRFVDDRAELDDAAPEAALRDAIMRGG